MKTLLTQREAQILSLMQEGFITKEVAATLKISLRTVETHRRNINLKLDAHNVSDAIRKARLLYLIS